MHLLSNQTFNTYQAYRTYIMISVIVCSRQASSWDLHRRNVEKTVGCDYEYIRIDNTNNTYNLCAAYNKGSEQAKANFSFLSTKMFFSWSPDGETYLPKNLPMIRGSDWSALPEPNIFSPTTRHGYAPAGPTSAAGSFMNLTTGKHTRCRFSHGTKLTPKLWRSTACFSPYAALYFQGVLRRQDV